VGGWEIRDSANAVVRSKSGSASASADNFSLPVGVYTFHVTPVSSYAETVRVNSSATDLPTPYSFGVTDSSSISLLGYYSQTAPADPMAIQLEDSPCQQIRFSWQDGSSNENGFRLYYRTSATGANNFIADVAAAAGFGSRQYYTYSTPPMVPLWIVVQAYADYPPRVYSGEAVSSSSYTPQACYGDLSSSTKRIISVNGAAYDPTEPGKDGDMLTFRITIQNNGTDSVSIQNILD
jgi:hypothetical protein